MMKMYDNSEEPSSTRLTKELIMALEQLKAQIAARNREILALARTDMYLERVKLLTTVPGIGVPSAMERLTELGDVARFPSNDALASYLGLTPSGFSPGRQRAPGTHHALRQHQVAAHVAA